MDMMEAFQRVGLALAIGLLVGIERGWQEREMADGERAAGIRTFALVGLLGGLAGYLGAVSGPVVPAALGIGLMAAFIVFTYRAATPRNDFSVTGVIAALVVFALGIVSATGDMRLAAAGGVVTTVLLAARHSLHGFLKTMTWVELRSALVLLTMSFVALPLLPNRAIDPWGGFNPFTVWLMTIMIAALSYAGYVAMRVAGPERGILFAGATGGIVSSTATTLSFAHISTAEPALSRQLAGAASIAGGLSLVRCFIIGSAVAPALIVPLAAALAPGLLVFVAASLILIGRNRAVDAKAGIELSNPFELGAVLRFGALLGAVGFIARVLVHFLGPDSITVIALVSGIPDLDAITLSTAHMAGSALPVQTAAFAVLIAAASNLITKVVLALGSGTRVYGRFLGLVTLAVMAVGGVGFWLFVNFAG
ncbi:MgtC/SapB family protein [Martelella lutilitoris]|uniref:MgtC/SapB family protein n=1 Tax=Martelella lutilitoris TaxID=2583532 RepID=A0A5C4JQA7_9HYPH|nr:MgtC/SapB family protein [Martelella lutilitoris]TNB47467.1 MgtC/SapB family protein [Martelella lutilitoris]